GPIAQTNTRRDSVPFGKTRKDAATGGQYVSARQDARALPGVPRRRGADCSRVRRRRGTRRGQARTRFIGFVSTRLCSTSLRRWEEEGMDSILMASKPALAHVIFFGI